MEFSHAIVRRPGADLAHALTTAKLGPPDPAQAAGQHEDYARALQDLGMEVVRLPALPGFPDATFVEDVAVLAGDLAVLTRPGAPSREGEVAPVETALRDHFADLVRIEAPGRLDGGDVLAIGEHHLIGLSERSDESGAEQLLAHLARHGLTGEVVRFAGMLHLKSGVAWLGGEDLLVAPELAPLPALSGYRRHLVPEDESYAANSVAVNGTIVMPAGHPRTAELIHSTGRGVAEVEVAEFEKLEGGVSCLSLRFRM